MKPRMPYEYLMYIQFRLYTNGTVLPNTLLEIFFRAYDISRSKELVLQICSEDLGNLPGKNLM